MYRGAFFMPMPGCTFPGLGYDCPIINGAPKIQKLPHFVFFVVTASCSKMESNHHTGIPFVDFLKIFSKKIKVIFGQNSTSCVWKKSRVEKKLIRIFQKMET